jgi:uncharacterized protein (DUF2141 family)
MKYELFAVATAAIVAAMSSHVHAQSEPTATAAQSKSTSTCATLQFTGLKTGEGLLMIAAYGSAETYLKKPVWVNAVKVDKETMNVPVCDVAAAEIAVTAFQDVNGNGKLDSNPMGIPSEPYGASGTPAMFSAPTWNDTKVLIAGSTSPIVVKF